MRKILQCIQTIDELNIEQLNELEVGVEMQDFTEPNLTEKEKQDLTERYSEAFKNFNGTTAMHGPFLDLKPASPDVLIREASYKRYFDAIQIATAIDVDYLIFHSQINPLLNHPELTALNNKQANDFWTNVIKETNFKGTILIENIFEGPEVLAQYMEVVQFPNVKVNLDIGHAKVAQTDLEEWFETMGEQIVYMHVHSNDGVQDQHRAPNKSEIETLYEWLDRYEMNPVLSLEYQTKDFADELKKYR